MAVRFQLRRDTAADWTNSNAVLAEGEMGFEIDTSKIKIGDGSSTWTELGYAVTKDFNNLINVPTTIDGYGITDGLKFTSLSVTQNSASGLGALSYNNTNGKLTYTPPDLSSLIELTDLSITSTAASGSGALSYNNSTGVFTFTPADLSSLIELTDLSVSTNSASAGGALSYNNSTGAFTYTPPDLSSFISLSDLSVVSSSGPGSITYSNSTGVFTYTPPSDTQIRSKFSVVDNGGDGSLSYNNNTGVFTYQGPSATETRAHFSGGTGVTITNGEVAIGQAVATTSDVTFNTIETASNIIVGGNLTVNGTTTSVNTETITLDDNIILLNSNAEGSASEDAGIEIERGDDTNVSLLWDETENEWTIGSERLVAGTFEGNIESAQIRSTEEAIILGSNAGVTTPGTRVVAIGFYAGEEAQGENGVAIGNSAGRNTQGTDSIAIGNLAASFDQGNNAIAIGRGAGARSLLGQGQYGIAIGYAAGDADQAQDGIAIGRDAGQDQDVRSIAIGLGAGASNQGSSAIAIGDSTAGTNQGNYAIAIGEDAAVNGQGQSAIAIGRLAGNTTQGLYGIAIGQSAGSVSQLQNGIAIGNSAGEQSQSISIAIGPNAGKFRQAERAIAIGDGAAWGDDFNNQTIEGIAIGYRAATNGQGNHAIAIGALAGGSETGAAQDYGAIAIGKQAGMDNQGSASVALGRESGETDQGNFAVAVGFRAGETSQTANSIILNATGNPLNNTETDSFTVKPVRFNNTDNLMFYDATSGEITYNSQVPNLELESNANGSTGQISWGTIRLSVRDDAGGGAGSIFLSGGNSNYPTTTSAYSVTIGGWAAPNASGSRNVVIGNSAGYTLSTGTDNVVIGQSAGYFIQSGSENIFVGKNAGGGNGSSTVTGVTAIGHNALEGVAGDNNIAIGKSAGQLITTGTGNVIIGPYTGNTADLNITQSDDNVVIANGSGGIVFHANSSKKVELPGGLVNRTAFFTSDIDTDAVDMALFAIETNTTFTTSGTPVDGQRLMIRLTAVTTATLTWTGTDFRAISVTLPTSITSSNTLYVGCIYNDNDTIWDVLSVTGI
jgi:hypothetical protein